jgi:hypothetical protein
MTKAALAPFYGVTPGQSVPSSFVFASSSWAFSDAAPDAVNTCMRTPRPDPSHGHPRLWGNPMLYLYRLRFSLSAPNRSAPKKGLACGAGSATLIEVRRGEVFDPMIESYSITGASEYTTGIGGIANPGYGPFGANPDCSLLYQFEPTATRIDISSQPPADFPSLLSDVFTEWSYPGLPRNGVVYAFYDHRGEMHALRGNPGGIANLTGNGWDGGTTGMNGFIAPWFCREAAIRFDPVYLTGLLDVHGHFARLGTLRFPEVTASFDGFANAFPWHWYANDPLLSQMCFGAVVNPGPTTAYVMSNGIRFPHGANQSTTRWSSDYIGGIGGEMTLHLQGADTLFVGADCILDGMSPVETNFIGSV